jgi:FixJ family two-component response regulator
MSGLNGIELQAALNAGGVERIIFITEVGDIPVIVRAIKGRSGRFSG